MYQNLILIQVRPKNNIIKKRVFLSNFFVIINKPFYNNINIEIISTIVLFFVIKKP